MLFVSCERIPSDQTMRWARIGWQQQDLVSEIQTRHLLNGFQGRRSDTAKKKEASLKVKPLLLIGF